MPQPILRVKNLTVQLDGNKIIDNLSFKVENGEVLTILGPNGAGKSVLLRTLLGLLPYSGDITWSQKKIIGYLPQGLNQLMVKDLPLTVRDFFVLKNSQWSQKYITNYLKLVGLDSNILQKKAGHLSGGQFQRMLIAWVLATKPKILFLDEPITGIDIGGGETIYSLLRQIQEKNKLTIFLVTHDLNIVYKYSTNVLCLTKKGHFCFGSPKEILSPETLEEIFGMEIKFYEHK